MTNKGGNRGRPDSRRGEERTQQNARDEAVTRDPDIRGVRKGARDERDDRRR
jgi:hypothetical protein